MRDYAVRISPPGCLGASTHCRHSCKWQSCLWESTPVGGVGKHTRKGEEWFDEKWATNFTNRKPKDQTLVGAVHTIQDPDVSQPINVLQSSTEAKRTPSFPYGVPSSVANMEESSWLSSTPGRRETSQGISFTSRKLFAVIKGKHSSWTKDGHQSRNEDFSGGIRSGLVTKHGTSKRSCPWCAALDGITILFQRVMATGDNTPHRITAIHPC